MTFAPTTVIIPQSHRLIRTVRNLLLFECCPNKTWQRGGCRFYYHANQLRLNLEQVLEDICFLLLPISLLSENLALTRKATFLTRQCSYELAANEVIQ